MSTDAQRCFLAFELCEDSRAYLAQRLRPWFERLSETEGQPVRWIRPENWHATLLFFAGLSAAQRQTVWEEAERCARSGVWSALDFQWLGATLWPSARLPNLICVEAAPHDGARAWPITARLDSAPFALGETGHLRRYRPHITVMRLQRGKRQGARRANLGAGTRSAVSAAPPTLDGARIRFDRLSFFLSTLSAEQPIYPRERTVDLSAALP